MAKSIQANPLEGVLLTHKHPAFPPACFSPVQLMSQITKVPWWEIP